MSFKIKKISLLSIKNKLNIINLNCYESFSFYPIIYNSYWRRFFFKKKKKRVLQYLTAVPNRGAGIGHQIANWNAGYWFSLFFNLKFAHIPFSNERWEKFLSFGKNEIKVADLVNKLGYKKIKIPYFNEKNDYEIRLIRKIIDSYFGMRVIFICEQDQFYFNQFGRIEAIKQKFNQAVARKSDKSYYKDQNFNIAIHVRRFSIHVDEKVRAKRWLGNDYYEKVLLKVVKNLHPLKPIKIHVFSTAKADEFLEFSKYGEIMFCNNFNEYESFLHLLKADLLITSKSSFSYKAALISDGIKVCPKDFWHGYPTEDNWILVDDDGDFNSEVIKKLL